MQIRLRYKNPRGSMKIVFKKTYLYTHTHVLIRLKNWSKKSLVRGKKWMYVVKTWRKSVEIAEKVWKICDACISSHTHVGVLARKKSHESIKKSSKKSLTVLKKNSHPSLGTPTHMPSPLELFMQMSLQIRDKYWYSNAVMIDPNGLSEEANCF